MTKQCDSNFFTDMCLIAGVAMPILYFGAQLAAAPFYPDYSSARDSASMLGSPFSPRPWIFDLGAAFTGIAALAASVGLYRPFRNTTNILIAWPICLSVAATGVMSLKAGIFPLPDSRHASWGFLVAFTIITPLLLLVGIWKHRDAQGVRLYLFAPCVLVVLLFPFLTGMISTRPLQPGTFQRLFAMATFIPVGVVAHFF